MRAVDVVRRAAMLAGAALLMEAACLPLPFGESPITERTRSRRAAEVAGPVTARGALAVVRKDALQVSKTVELRGVSSGEDIDHNGRSRTWRFVLAFPSRKGLGVFELEPCAAEAEDGSLCLSASLSPAGASREGKSLPMDFVDSPEAVRRLASAGCDWVSGPTNLSLSTRQLADGAVVWHVSTYGKDYETPFESRPSG